jgi:hypothetical protein
MKINQTKPNNVNHRRTVTEQVARGTKFLSVIALAALSGYGVPLPAQESSDADPCVTLFKDTLLRKFSIKTESRDFSELKTYLLSDTFLKDIQKSKWGASVTIPIEGVPVTLGANFTKDQYEEFRQKVMSWTSQSIDRQFCQTVTSSIPDPEMAKQFNDCMSDRDRDGFRIQVTPSENSPQFKIIYRNKFTGIPLPIVKSFRVEGAKSARSEIKVGKKVQNEMIVSCQRDPQMDLILILQTDRDALVYKLPGKPLNLAHFLRVTLSEFKCDPFVYRDYGPEGPGSWHSSVEMRVRYGSEIKAEGIKLDDPQNWQSIRNGSFTVPIKDTDPEVVLTLTAWPAHYWMVDGHAHCQGSFTEDQSAEKIRWGIQRPSGGWRSNMFSQAGEPLDVPCKDGLFSCSGNPSVKFTHGQLRYTLEVVE